MAQIRADEITRVLRDEIENYERAINVAETGFVISVGDGIARVYGLETVMAGELVQFPHNVSGLALNLEEDQVGTVLLGDYTEIKEGDDSRRFFRPCLLYAINQCTAPCAAKIPKDSYAEDVSRLLRFLEGNHKQILRELEKEMGRAPTNEEISRRMDIPTDKLTALHPEVLRKFTSDTGKIIPRRITGVSAWIHRRITREIKRSRALNLMP